MNDDPKGYFYLVSYSILAGLVSIFVKLTNGLTSAELVFFRALFATLFLFAVACLIGRLKDLSLKNVGNTLLVGLLQGISIGLFFAGLLRAPVSNVVFLLYTAPIFSVILSRVFLKERILISTITGVAITLFGVLCVIDPGNLSFQSTQTVGNLLGLGGGFFYAAMAIAAKPLSRENSGLYIAFWQYLLISLLALPFIGSDLSANFSDNWWQLILIGVLCTGIPFVFFMAGVRLVAAQRVFVVTAIEPLTAAFAAVIVLGEMLSPLTILGAVLILSGVYVASRKAVRA